MRLFILSQYIVASDVRRHVKRFRGYRLIADRHLKDLHTSVDQLFGRCKAMRSPYCS